MNPMLKIAYDYGCQQAIQDMEKQADAATTLLRNTFKNLSGIRKFDFKNPYTIGSALTGGLSGGIAGGLNAEEGQGLKGFLSGALGGAALGGAAGHFGSKALMGKKDYYLGQKYRRQGILANRQADPKIKEILMDNISSTMKQYPISNAAIGKQLAGVAGAGVLGGLGAGYLSGANDKPWYQRMNPFG